MKKTLISLALITIASSTFSKPHIIRDAETYHLTGYTAFIVRTQPIQAYQPVYLWRSHVKFDWTAGQLGANAQYIGETDANGVMSSVIDVIEENTIYCGYFFNERVSVGGTSSAYPKSDSVNFKILDTPRTGFGPFPPPKPECVE